jgi:hypothetical protein
MPIITQTDFTQQWKIFMRTTAVVIGSTAAWSGMQELKAEDFGHLYIISIPVLLACIAGLIYSARHKIVLTDQALWQYGFFTKGIPLTDIERISENKISGNKGAYLIKSAKKSINITPDLCDQIQFKDHLLARLQELDREKNRMPGRELSSESQQKLFEQIQLLLDRADQEDIKLEVDASFSNQLTEPAYFLVCGHIVHGSLNRAYDTESHLLRTFFHERIALPTGPGMTLFILPHHLKWLFICSNDGDLFLIRVAE